MKPALAQVCSLQSPFEKDIADYAAGACRAIEVWLGKLEGFLDRNGIDRVRQLVDQHGVELPAASYQGGLFEAAANQQHWKSFETRLALCRGLGIPVLVVAADMAGPISDAYLAAVMRSLREAAARAASYGVRLALECQARAALANNLQTAAALVEEVGSPWLGLCLDVFHYYVGPSKLEDLGYLTPDTIFHVQLSDLADRPRELAADSDRILPGDGDFQLEPIVAHLRAIGYGGYVSVELMNPQIWQIPARQFGEIAMTALRKTLGQASME